MHINLKVLFMKVHEKPSIGKVLIDEIADYIKGSYPKKESGIVYCFSRKECEQVIRIFIVLQCILTVDIPFSIHLRWEDPKIIGLSPCFAFKFLHSYLSPLYIDLVMHILGLLCLLLTL